MKKETLKRNWILHYIKPEYLYLPRKEKDNKKGHQVFIYLRYGRNSNWYNLTSTQLQNTVIGVYNNKGELIYCTAYNNNGTIVSTLAGSGFAITKLPYITTDYDVGAYNYLILPYGDYSVKVMRYGTNLNTYTGVDSFAFTVNNDGQTGTQQYVYVNLFSEDYISYQMTFKYEWKDYSEVYDIEETVIPHPGTVPQYGIYLTTPELRQYGDSGGYATDLEYNEAVYQECQNIPVLTYYRNYRGSQEKIGDKTLLMSTKNEGVYTTLLAKDGYHVYVEKRKVPTYYLFHKRVNNSKTMGKYRVNASKFNNVEFYIIPYSWVNRTTPTFYPYEGINNVSGSNWNNDKYFIDRYGYVIESTFSATSSFSWMDVGAERSTTTKDFDTTMKELSTAFLSAIGDIVAETDNRWERQTGNPQTQTPSLYVPKSIVFNNSDSWQQTYNKIDSIEYGKVKSSVQTDIVIIPLVDFGEDYDGYTAENYWTTSGTSILYRYKPLVVDMNDVPNYTP